MVPEEEGGSECLLFKHSVECASGTLNRLFSQPSPACGTNLQDGCYKRDMHCYTVCESEVYKVIRKKAKTKAKAPEGGNPKA